MLLGKPCVIPLYLPLEVSLGLHSERADTSSWTKFISELKALDRKKLGDYEELPMNKGNNSTMKKSVMASQKGINVLVTC